MRGRRWEDPSCCSPAWTGDNSRDLETCGHRALPICLWLSWETRTGADKEQGNEQRHECDVQCRRASSCERHGLTDEVVLLGGAAGILGISLVIYRAAGRGSGVPARVYRHAWTRDREDARDLGYGGNATAKCTGCALRHGIGIDDGGGDRGGSVLRAGCAVRGAARSQHLILEVAAGFRSHNGAGEGEHSNPYSATSVLDHCGGAAVPDAADSKRGNGGQWRTCFNAVVAAVTDSDVDHAAEPSDYGARALVCAFLCMDAAGFELGAARTVSVGGAAGDCARGPGEACMEYELFLSVPGRPSWRESGRCVCEGLAGESDDATYADSFPAQSAIVGGIDLYSAVHFWRSAIETLSHIALSQIAAGLHELFYCDCQ